MTVEELISILQKFHIQNAEVCFEINVSAGDKKVTIANEVKQIVHDTTNDEIVLK